jgi:hypothetical protein
MESTHVGNAHRPANKGRRYPADPPKVEEIVAVMRQAGDARMAFGCAASSSCSGARAFGSPRLSP